MAPRPSQRTRNGRDEHLPSRARDRRHVGGGPACWTQPARVPRPRPGRHGCGVPDPGRRAWPSGRTSRSAGRSATSPLTGAATGEPTDSSAPSGGPAAAPATTRRCRSASSGPGFAAVEAEFVVRLRQDVPAPRGGRWTADDAAGVAYDLLVGVEVASSPVPAINDLGPTVVAADFGNNNGLVLGPSLSAGDGCRRPAAQLLRRRRADGSAVPRGPAGGLHHALATAWNVLADRGHPIRAGLLFATGAITGIHEVVPGQIARVEVEGGPADRGPYGRSPNEGSRRAGR